ncbi:MAG TPA: hypothetical protein GX507_08325 [Clostridia bacterium]|nr:hypothetical protein [Clostridia bacterium]
MSVIASYAADIRLPVDIDEPKTPLERTPGWLALKDAVEATAEEFGGFVFTEVTDYFGRSAPCDFAVITPSFGRGVGIRVDRSTGEVFFLYDAYGGFEYEASKIKQRVLQNFSAVAIARALESLHYEVEYEERRTEGGKEILLRGVL